MEKLFHLNTAINLAKLSFKNCIRLHNDSILLYRKKSFPSAYFFSIIAIEELGKVFILDDLIYHAKVDGRHLESELERIKMLYNHQTKQYKFVSDAADKLPKQFIKLVIEKRLDKKKQDSLYVGFPKNIKNKSNTKINNPLDIKISEARNQISILNENLINLINGIIEDDYIIEIGFDKRIFSKILLKQLKSNWKHSVKENKYSFFEYFNEYHNKKEK